DMRRIITSLLLASGILMSGMTANAADQVHVKMSTSMGVIEIMLDAERAPRSVANFVRYVNEGFYNGTIFHRVIGDFMIQGGGFTANMKQKATHGSISNEADNGLRNSTGTIAMARTGAPHSATSQFFINTHDNGFLNFKGKTRSEWGYAVFGRVSKGMDVVRAIEAVQTGYRSGMGDVPQEPVIIQGVEIIE
ncbi:MAG: peptidylprolyl isomerase, partial [Mariprofundaceae bacterium]|nr:peptidylprolyl isomerase [Mariprofundaceae bacterium]